MAFSLSGSTITQSGTDTDLSGLNGIAGVTLIQDGDFNLWIFDGVQLNIEGTLSISPNTNLLYFKANQPGSYALQVNNSGVLNVGTVQVVNGDNVYESGTWLKTTYKGVVAWAGGSITIRGTINWNGGAIDVAASPQLLGTINVGQGQIYLRETNVQVARVLLGGNASPSNLTVYNNGFGPNSTYTGELKNNTLVHASVIGIHGTVPTLTIEDHDFVAKGTILPQFDGSKWYSKNDARGTASPAGHNTDNSFILFTKDQDITFQNQVGSLVQGVKVFTTEYDDGKRETVSGVDFSTVEAGLETSDASGLVSFRDWRIGVHFRSGSVKQTFFTKNLNNTDIQDFRFCSYLHQVGSLDIELKGAGIGEVNWTLIDDALISETSKAAVDALPVTVTYDSGTRTLTYTGDNATIQTMTTAQAYDLAKSYLVDNYSGERNVLVLRVGDTLDGTLNDINIVLDYIELTGNITTTGTITTLNGANVVGGLIDSTADSYFDFSNEWEIYANLADRNASTNELGSGTADQNFRFNYVPGVIYYAWHGGTKQTIQATQAGLNVVDLSLAGQLSELSNGQKTINNNVIKASKLIPANEIL